MYCSIVVVVVVHHLVVMEMLVVKDFIRRVILSLAHLSCSADHGWEYTFKIQYSLVYVCVCIY